MANLIMTGDENMSEFKLSAERRAAVNKAVRAHRARRKAEYEAQGVAAPIPESIRRHRRCRACGAAVEPKSYYYCAQHNIHAESDDDNILYSPAGIDVESY
jgi:hypothetical protein